MNKDFIIIVDKRNPDIKVTLADFISEIMHRYNAEYLPVFYKELGKNLLEGRGFHDTHIRIDEPYSCKNAVKDFILKKYTDPNGEYQNKVVDCQKLLSEIEKIKKEKNMVKTQVEALKKIITTHGNISGDSSTIAGILYRINEIQQIVE